MLIYMHLEMGYILAYNLLVFMYLCVHASFRGFSCCVLSPHSYFEVSLSFYNVFYMHRSIFVNLFCINMFLSELL